ncbi:hypothetical protein M0802_007064, partial [Mischocyttarus mexicanus]
QTTTSYEPKDLSALARGRPTFDPGSSARAHFDRAFSFSGRQPVDHQQQQQQQQQQQSTGRTFGENRLFLDQRTGADSKKEKLETRPAYGSSKSFDGYSSAVEELNWQERCLELQLELHRSRNQTIKVRDMLREKLIQSIITITAITITITITTTHHYHHSHHRTEFTRYRKTDIIQACYRRHQSIKVTNVYSDIHVEEHPWKVVSEKSNGLERRKSHANVSPREELKRNENEDEGMLRGKEEKGGSGCDGDGDGIVESWKRMKR